MKKTLMLILATACVSYASHNAKPYRIFVHAFSTPNNPLALKTEKELRRMLKNRKNFHVRRKQMDGYYVVVVETVSDEATMRKVFRQIKSRPGHKDIYVLPASKADPVKPVMKPYKTPYVEPRVSKPVKPKIPSKNYLSLKSAIHSVLSTNPNLKQRIYAYMETGKELDVAHRRYYPTLDLRASAGIGRDRIDMDKWKDSVEKSVELRLVQNLYDGGATVNNKEQSINQMTNASFLVLETADRTSLAMVDAYLNVIKERTLLKLAGENMSHISKIYSRIRERSDSGFGRKSEKQQAASRLSLAKSNYISQQNAYFDSLTTFKKLSGIYPQDRELMMPKFIYELPSSPEEVERIAFKCNPSLRAQRSNINLAHNILQSDSSNFLPKLDLEAFAKWKNTYNYAYDHQRHDSYGALLRFQYNLYNGGIDKAKKEQHRVLVQKEQEVLNTLKNDLRESLNFSWQSYILNSKKMAFVAEHAKYSKKTLQSYKEEFNIGRRELINVLDAENEYFNAQKEIIVTRKDLLYSKYRLLDNMGLITDSFKAGFGQDYIKDACSIVKADF